MITFNIGNWYWLVGDDSERVWSSAKAGFVSTLDATYQVWAADRFPTRIASLAELQAVFAAQYPAGSLATYNAARRFDVETGGIDVDGARIATDRPSQAMISGAFNFASANPDALVQFKTAEGFLELNAAQIKVIASLVGAHVQALFKKEAEIDAAIRIGAITSIADIDARYQASS